VSSARLSRWGTEIFIPFLLRSVRTAPSVRVPFPTTSTPILTIMPQSDRRTSELAPHAYLDSWNVRRDHPSISNVSTRRRVAVLAINTRLLPSDHLIGRVGVAVLLRGEFV